MDPWPAAKSFAKETWSKEYFKKIEKWVKYIVAQWVLERCFFGLICLIRFKGSSMPLRTIRRFAWECNNRWQNLQAQLERYERSHSWLK